MTLHSLLAVAAPAAHIEVNAAPQATPDLTVANYLGGVVILAALVVMVLSGLSAAGIVSFRRSPKSASTTTSHTLP